MKKGKFYEGMERDKEKIYKLLESKWEKFVEYYLVLRDAGQVISILELPYPEQADVYLEHPIVKKSIAEADYKLLTGKADVDFVKTMLKFQTLRGKSENARLKALDQLVKLLNIKATPDDNKLVIRFENKKNAH